MPNQDDGTIEYFRKFHNIVPASVRVASLAFSVFVFMMTLGLEYSPLESLVLAVTFYAMSIGLFGAMSIKIGETLSAYGKLC
jgi:hypothetical protein